LKGADIVISNDAFKLLKWLKENDEWMDKKKSRENASISAIDLSKPSPKRSWQKPDSHPGAAGRSTESATMGKRIWKVPDMLARPTSGNDCHLACR
jgi:hypothetical protein